MLFTGSMRKNLDPLNQHTDEELWNALQEVSDIRVQPVAVWLNLEHSEPEEMIVVPLAVSSGAAEVCGGGAPC